VQIAFVSRLLLFCRGLLAFAHCLTGNAEQRDDLVQETCAQALAHKDQWQPGTNLNSWMLRIAQNLWLERNRAKKFHSEPVDIEMAGSDGWAVAENALAFADLLKALDHLSPKQRVLIALVCVDGLTYTEAADILSLPVGTVTSRLASARLALHDAVRAATACGATRH
jgi:RNA polymerase sigma-70 factor, ECF subfamily